MLLAGLGACALTPPPLDAGKAYMFALGQARVAKQTAVDAPLTVALPTTAPELDTYRIALTKNGKTWDYYAGAKWVEFLPVIVQNSLVEVLQQSGMFSAVAPDQSGLPGGWVLKTEIHDFQAEYDARHAAPLVRVRIAASLYHQMDRKITASFNVSAEKRAKSDSLPEIQASFQAAFNSAQQQLVSRLAKSQF
jgi:ABC-type uncharacterized transport system auxiliary subunit